MERLEAIMQEIRQRLVAEVPELAYVGRDRGELAGENPALEWPCALLDVRKVVYTQQGQGTQMADAQICVCVADRNPASAPGAAEGQFGLLGLAERIHAALHLLPAAGAAPLCRTELGRLAVAATGACYELIYRTAYPVGFDSGGTTVPAPPVALEVG